MGQGMDFYLGGSASALTEDDHSAMKRDLLSSLM
jgi:hypothetical protein